MNERNEEKRVPSSYLEILASTPSNMATNWKTRGIMNNLIIIFLKSQVKFFSTIVIKVSWYEAAPLQPEAESCPSHSPQSARLSGSGTVSVESRRISNKSIHVSKLKAQSLIVQHAIIAPDEVFTSWPISIAHNFADWSLASTITLNMVHNVGEMRKSVDLLLFASLDSNAILVLQCKLKMIHSKMKMCCRCSLCRKQTLCILELLCLSQFVIISRTVTQIHTVWHSSRSCCSTWAWCGSRGVWQTPPQASAGPWWKSGGRPASRRGPPMSRSHYCHWPKHTYTGQKTNVNLLPGRGGIKDLEGVGVVVARAEVDAVPLHFFFFTQFCSGHILTGPPTCLLSCLFRSFWTVSLWAKKEREGFTVTDQ